MMSFPASPIATNHLLHVFILLQDHFPYGNDYHFFCLDADDGLWEEFTGEEDVVCEFIPGICSCLFCIS